MAKATKTNGKNQLYITTGFFERNLVQWIA